MDIRVNLDNVSTCWCSTCNLGNIDANGDLDVDGHTELDDVNVSGVSTFTGTTNHTFTNITRSSNGVVLQLRNTSTANNAHTSGSTI